MREIQEVEAARQAAADLIRRRSEASQLAAPEEILQELKEQNILMKGRWALPIFEQPENQT